MWIQNLLIRLYHFYKMIVTQSTINKIQLTVKNSSMSLMTKGICQQYISKFQSIKWKLFFSITTRKSMTEIHGHHALILVRWSKMYRIMKKMGRNVDSSDFVT